MTANQRYKKALEWLLNQQVVRSKQHFFDQLNWTRNKSYNLERGDNAQLLGIDLLLLKKEFPQINWDWVVTGDGEMLTGTKTVVNEAPQIYGIDPANMNEKEAEILRIHMRQSELSCAERENRLIEWSFFQSNQIRKLAELIAKL